MALVVPRLGKALRVAAGPLLAAPLWAMQSREYTNFTYDISEHSLQAMIGAVSTVCDLPISEIAAYAEELLTCRELHVLVAAQHQLSRRRWSTDGAFRPGRRIVYYLLARAMRPQRIVEAGVDNGLGAAIICEAIRQNGMGEYIGIERDTEQPCALFENFAHKSGRILRRDAISALAGLDGPVGLFIHDTTPEPAHVRALLAAVPLAPGGVIETTWATPEVFAFAAQNGKHFLQIREEPRRHWYPGAQLGLVF